MERIENKEEKNKYMEKKEVILYIDELESETASEFPFCRICHEIEFESCKNLEAPCSCSGTVKFAHRDCIQRWCDEKGNTTCEICLQNFEPGYIAPIKKVRLLDVSVTIRGSLEVRRTGRAQDNPDIEATAREEQLQESECTTHDRPCNGFGLVALIFAVLLLMRHLITLLTGGSATEYYPFTLLTLLIAKTSVVFPMYVMIRIIASVYNSIRNSTRHHEPFQDSEDELTYSESEENEEFEEQNQVEHNVVIQSS